MRIMPIARRRNGTLNHHRSSGFRSPTRMRMRPTNLVMWYVRRRQTVTTSVVSVQGTVAEGNDDQRLVDHEKGWIECGMVHTCFAVRTNAEASDVA